MFNESRDNKAGLQGKEESQGDQSNTLKCRREFTKEMRKKIYFTAEAELITQAIEQIMSYLEIEEVLTTAQIVESIACAIPIAKLPRLSRLYDNIVEYSERLEQDESIGTKETCDNIKPKLEEVLVKYANIKPYKLPTLKQCHNDWKIWIYRVFAEIYTKQYTLIKLEREVKMNKSARYPRRWKEIDFKKDEQELLETFLSYSNF